MRAADRFIVVFIIVFMLILRMRAAAVTHLRMRACARTDAVHVMFGLDAELGAGELCSPFAPQPALVGVVWGRAGT